MAQSGIVFIILCPSVELTYPRNKPQKPKRPRVTLIENPAQPKVYIMFSILVE